MAVSQLEAGKGKASTKAPPVICSTKGLKTTNHFGKRVLPAKMHHACKTNVVKRRKTAGAIIMST
jgi:hypothetical protein